jgi:beta-glucosidase
MGAATALLNLLQEVAPAGGCPMALFLRLSSVLCAAAFALSLTPACAQLSSGVAPPPANAPYRNSALPVEERVKDLQNRMTLEEKASMMGGSGWMESFGVERLGIPAIKMADGPMGVRAWWAGSGSTNRPDAQQKIEATAFPSGIAMAATWDTVLVEREARAIGQEVKAFGRDMILGPTVNINRQPLWGRNFEGYGEDPYLSGRLAVAYVHGVQAEGVIPSVKHFAANNQEFERRRIDEQIDARTLHEIYLPAFKAAIQEGGAWAVMSAYNKVNGVNCSENASLLEDILRREFGFKGFVVSDWRSTYSTAAPLIAGLDLEMPGGKESEAKLAADAAQSAGVSGSWMTANKVLAEVKAGRLSESVLDRHVSYLLRIIFLSGLFDHPHAATNVVDTPEQRAVALQGATESIVLLKNEGVLLPFDAAKIHSIAVIGPSALVARTGGGGSSLVRFKNAISPLDGIRERAGSIQVTSSLGVSMEGDDPAQDMPEARAAAIKAATEAAAHADVAVVVVGRSSKIETESHDLPSMDLPAGQDDLIAAVEAANPRTVVVLNTGDPVTMTKWIANTPALVDLWFGGQEGGKALAAILFGDANPSGKLPVTFPKRWEDSPAYGHYPGENLKVDYAEGIYVGYRYFDTKNVEPQFPFGHGLSYSTFEYSDLKVVHRIEFGGETSVSDDVVALNVSNTGKRSGAEVVQLYVHDGHSKIDRPVHELKGFQRVELKPGESKTLSFHLDRAALSYWDPATKEWQADPGTFEVQVGASSRDIRLRAPLELK